MSTTLPLDADQLPEAIRKFARIDAPLAARTMAAKGLVPVRGDDLVTLLVQLTSDAEPTVRASAETTLSGLPDTVLLPACADALHPAILDEIARRSTGRDDVLEALVQNPAISETTLARIARSCSEPIGEIISTNQQRMLANPVIIEELYKNKNVRMSTADRLIELAARHDLELRGIPAYRAHVEAIKGQLIPEPTLEPLPSDEIFAAAVAADEEATAVEIDPVEGKEELKERYKPLLFRIREMSISERIRMAFIGDAAARSILLRDTNRLVAYSAATSPRMTAAEANAVAHSREVSDEVLRIVARRREWLRSYEIKRALLFNPKTPLAIALTFIDHMRPNDLRVLSRSRTVSPPVKQAAAQRLEKKKAR